MTANRHFHPRWPLCLLLLTGCGGLKLHLVDSSVQKPSNVALYFTVDTNRGDPVPGLTADSFKIYEDSQLISTFESKQTILNPEVAVAHSTLLLLDLSGSVTASGHAPALADAAEQFTSRVAKIHQVGVAAFDGRPDIQMLASFSSSEGALHGAVERVRTYQPRDPSTNLNGAVIEALKVLERQRQQAPVPLSFGTLVIFSDGTDRAHRVPIEALRKAIDETDIEVFVVGVGAEVDERELSSIGKSGAVIQKDQAQIAKAFDDMAARIEGFSRRYYLFSYCSPSRAGKHMLRIEANAPAGSGSLESEFDAAGFQPSCDPNRKPAFAIGKARRASSPRKTAPGS